MPLISDHLKFMPVLKLGILGGWDFKKGQFQFLVTLLAVFFCSANCTNLVCISSHILIMCNVLFEGFEYLVFSFLAFLSILSLFLLVFSPDLEMLHFWSVHYICQVCKLYFYLEMSEILDNIYISVFLVNSESVLLLGFVIGPNIKYVEEGARGFFWGSWNILGIHWWAMKKFSKFLMGHKIFSYVNFVF